MELVLILFLSLGLLSSGLGSLSFRFWALLSSLLNGPLVTSDGVCSLELTFCEELPVPSMLWVCFSQGPLAQSQPVITTWDATTKILGDNQKLLKISQHSRF